jgi:hypothetical protein
VRYEIKTNYEVHRNPILKEEIENNRFEIKRKKA